MSPPVFLCDRWWKEIVKKRFSTFYIANTLFWTTKTSVSKTHKIGIFAQGLVHGFGKYDILLKFRFIQNTPRKSIWWRSFKKQAFLDNLNTDLKRSHNLHFCKGDSPWFWSKSWSFFIICCYQKQLKKQCLLTFYIKKKPLKTIKTTVYEKRKIRIFPNGLVHRFCQKIWDFFNFDFYGK